VITDSGGIQEEASSLGKPVFVLRDITERPEAVKSGAAKVIGTKTDRIVSEVNKLLNNRKEYNRMSRAVNPYGDGKAAGRITKALLYYFKIKRTVPFEFRPVERG
jgi:UDP-N-acetylglucosamine 2-epimerase (non-hydrolysing)